MGTLMTPLSWVGVGIIGLSILVGVAYSLVRKSISGKALVFLIVGILLGSYIFYIG